MSQIPLCSSDRIIKAFRRAGFVDDHCGKTHLSMTRQDDTGRTRIAVIPLKKTEVPRWTLKGILEVSGMTVEEFRRHLR